MLRPAAQHAVVLAVFAALVWAALTPKLHAADPLFVGNLALVVQNDVAEQLGLTPEQRTQLIELANRREDAALELAIAAKRLTAVERKRRLAQFVAESERLGAAILTPSQASKLKALQLQQDGFAALGRPDIAAAIDLTDQQREQVDQLMRQRQQELATANQQRKAVVRALYERRLNRLLTEPQRRGWERLTSVNPDQFPPAAEAEVAAGDLETNGQTESGRSAASDTTPSEDGLKFNFRYAAWDIVLEWFADNADLSLVLDSTPPGTFNYSDNRVYSPADAIDLLNSVLLTKGYTLVRRDRMLLLINLEDGIPPNLVTAVPLQELDRRGEFELISCLFPVQAITPDEAADEIQDLIGPQGNIQVLPKARQVLVTETAGRLRTIRNILNAIEDPESDRNQEITAEELRHILPEQALVVIRQMLGLPEDQNASPDGTLRMIPDPLGTRLMLTGTPQMVRKVGEILKLIDIPTPASEGGILATPQLEVYSVNSADPESVLKVMQTLLDSEPGVRLASDAKTGNLIAMGLPSHHATIRATLEQMERDGQTIEVLKLRYIDPQLAVLSVNKLFGVTEGVGNPPRVDADITTSQLLVRGTKAQVEQIRTLLDKMGETGEVGDELKDRTRNVRLIPLTGGQADSILQKAGAIWPSLRPNPIRQVTPSEAIRSVLPRSIPQRDPPRDIQQNDAIPAKPADDRQQQPPPQESADALTDHHRSTLAMALMPVTVQVQADPTESDKRSSDETAERPAIVITKGSNGLLIASQDLEALNEFEDLLLSLADREVGSKQEFAVFYLRHATAAAAKAVLNEVLGGGSDSAADGEGGAAGGLLGSLAGAALGDSGGGLVGSLLGLGGDGAATSYTATGSYNLVAENRLNCLIVQANSDDMLLIEQLLEIIDQRMSPQPVETIPSPRLIPVVNTNAEEIAELVRTAFSSRMASSPGQPRQPTPEEFIRALRGGNRSRDSGRNREREEAQSRMTVSVDKRRNALIVAAPDALFAEVKQLVSQLDQVDPELAETTRIITLRQADRELVRRTLSTLVGQPQEISKNASSRQESAARPASGGGATPARPGQQQRPPAANRPRGGGEAEAMRRLEFLRAIQQRQNNK